MTKLQLYPYQETGVEFLRARKRAYLADEMGLGKAITIDTPILTPTGWSRMGDIKVGDEVVAVDGTPTRVTGVYPQGIREIYEIEFSDGAVIKCDADHLWEVTTATREHRGSTPLVKTTAELAAGPLTYSSGGRKWRVPLVEPVQFQNTEDRPLDAYTLGVILGDGSVTGERKSISLSTDVDIMENLTFPEGSTQGKIGSPYPNAPYNGYQRVSNTRQYVEPLGLWGCLAHEKFIPSAYLFAPVEDRIALLQGLLDTDGSPTTARGKPACSVEYGTVSAQLSRDVKHLVESLGGLATTSVKKPSYAYDGEKKTGQDYYRMTVRLPNNIAPFRLQRKLNRWEPRTRPPARHIVDIREAGQEEAVCIRVDHPRHLFVVDHFVVTHNTSQMITASQGDTLVVAPAMIIDSGTWTNEIEKWADDPDRFTLTAFSRINERDGRKLTAKPHPDFNRPWDTILIDEAHYLKNRDAKRTQAMMKIIKKADRVYLASGTPIPNWSHELFVPLQILRPDQAKPGGELGSYWRWVEKWFRVSESPFGHGSLDIGRLRGCTPACDRRGLDDPCAHYRRFVQGNMEDQFIRRLRDDVLQDLPALTTQEVRIPMKPKQWTEYRRMRREFIAEVGDTELVAWNTAARHTNLDKITTSLGMLAGGDPLTDSGKFDRLAADLAERTRPTIVVGHYRATVEAAAAVARSLGKKVRVIHGGTGNRERELTVKQFQQNKIDVLVGSYDTISEGLTLTAADTMILVETSYKAARNDQVIRRIHRIGQEHSCLVLDYISTGPAGQSTLDVSKRKLLAQKKKGIEHALSGSTIKEML